jgi:hypothetical protein
MGKGQDSATNASRGTSITETFHGIKFVYMKKSSLKPSPLTNPVYIPRIRGLVVWVFVPDITHKDVTLAIPSLKMPACELEHGF